jgi:hypothetical protein
MISWRKEIPVVGSFLSRMRFDVNSQDEPFPILAMKDACFASAAP